MGKEMTNLFIADTYEALSSRVADDMLAILQAETAPLVCTASGDSPAGLYKELVKRVQEGSLDIANWYFVGLDEWLGMNGSDDGSCRFHLDQQLFHPLHIEANRICFFDGRSEDLEAECNRIESFIQQHGGIDVAIVGLGMNGHIGMNEPGTSPSLHSHVTDLDPVTQQVGQKYFKQQQQLTGGITLGIANLMEARHVFLIVSGSHKATIVQQLLQAPVSESLPASLLRQHPGFRIYIDQPAASRITTENDGA